MLRQPGPCDEPAGGLEGSQSLRARLGDAVPDMGPRKHAMYDFHSENCWYTIGSEQPLKISIPF